MIGKSVLKVPGGKLLRVEVEHEAGVVKRVKLTGDFFLYPEDAIGEIERSLVGCEVNEIAERVDNIASRGQAQLIGFTPQDVQDAIKLAVEGAQA